MVLAAGSSVLSTAIVGGILLIVVVLVIRSMWIKKKKTGSCVGCSCGCSDCPHSSKSQISKLGTGHF